MKLRDKIQRMKEIWRIWGVLNLFYKNRVILAVSKITEEAESKYKDKATDLALEIMEKKYPDCEPGSVDFIQKIKDCRKEAQEELDEVKPLYTQRGFWNIDKEPSVNTHELEEIWLKNIGLSNSNLFSDDDYAREACQKAKIKFASMLESCISLGYIGRDEDKSLYMTTVGKKVAGFDGWLRLTGEAITEVFGVWRTILATVIATVSLLNFHAIIIFIKKITGIG